MKAVTKFYLKLFMFTGIPFGLFLMGVDWLGGKPPSFMGFALKAFLFGLVMAFFLGGWHLSGLKKLGVKVFTDENLSVRHKKQIVLNLTREEMKVAIEKDAHFSSLPKKEVEGGIRLRTKVGISSWGSYLYVKVKPIDDKKNEFIISSKPVLFLTIIDSGLGYDGVNKLVELLEKAAKNKLDKKV